MATVQKNVSSGTLPKPRLAGWHLVTFENGTVALVRWANGKWAWGSTKHPATSTIVSYSYLGGRTINDVLNHAGDWEHALSSLPPKQQLKLIELIDHGVTGLKGQPAVVSTTGSTGQSVGGSEAVSANVIPSPSISNPLGSIFGIFTTLAFWKGIGLVLAGAAVIVFAALEFRKMT
jgi:hypothetical protein